LAFNEAVEVLYSPVKAFQKITAKPDTKGVLLVLLLVIVSSVAVQYVTSSRRLLEVQYPEEDGWTEQLSNQHRWESNGALTLNGTDLNVGNYSIAASASDESTVWLKLSEAGPVNCSEKVYSELFLWIKWTRVDGAQPTAVTVKLFSGGGDSYEKNITDLLAGNGEWANVTLNVGPEQGWAANGSADWQNITAIELTLSWAEPAECEVKVDGLIFRNFATSIERGTFILEVVSVVPQVGINWILWAGLLIIVSKFFQEELGHWSTVFIIIGYVFMVTIVTNMVALALSSALPQLTYLLDPTATYYYSRNPEAWINNAAYQLLIPLAFIEYGWIIGLSSVAIKTMKGTSWSRALTITVLAFAIRFVLSMFGI